MLVDSLKLTSEAGSSLPIPKSMFLEKSGSLGSGLTNIQSSSNNIEISRVVMSVAEDVTGSNIQSVVKKNGVSITENPIEIPVGQNNVSVPATSLLDKNAQIDSTFEVEIVQGSDGQNLVCQIDYKQIKEIPAGPVVVERTILENSSEVGNIPNSSNSAGVVYSISGGADADKFQFSNGVLSFINPPDFETPNSAEGNNTYRVNLARTDSEGSTITHYVRVIVDDVVEFITPSLNTTVFNVAENNITVATLTATANDSPTFTLESGADADKFELAPTGELTFKNLPDFENPSSVAASNSYVLNVRITDSQTSAVDQVTVNVTDVDDNWSLVVQKKIPVEAVTSNGLFGIESKISNDGSMLFASARNMLGRSTNGSGFVISYIKSGNDWVQNQVISPNLPEENAQFGHRLAISKNGVILVVSAYGENTSGVGDSGAAYIFTRNGNTWNQQQKLQASTLSTSDLFGTAVSVSDNGSTIFVAAKKRNISANNAGLIYVFEYNGSVWNEQAVLQADNPQAGSEFGDNCISVSADGNRVVSGAKFRTEGGLTKAGAAYYYTRTGSTWTFRQKIMPSVSAQDAEFGYSSVLSGDGSLLAISSCRENSNTGAVYIYTRSGETWTEVQRITGEYSNTFFGWRIALSDSKNIMVISAIGSGSPSGLPYLSIYAKNGNSFSLVRKIEGAHADSSSLLGHGLGITGDGNYIVAGGHYHNDGQTNSGIVEVFTSNTSNSDLNLNSTNFIEEERQTYVATLTSSGSGTKSYKLTGGSDEDKFNLSSNGDLTFKTAPDFENPSSAASTNTYFAVAQVANETESKESPISVVVSDIDENWLTASQNKIVSDPRKTDGYFGINTAISSDGNTLVVGARTNPSLNQVGDAYVFTRSGQNTWTQQQKLAPSDGVAGDWFGNAVGISADGNLVFVSSRKKTNAGFDRAGVVYVFSRSGSTWTQIARLNTNNAHFASEFGFPIKLADNGNLAFITAIYQNSSFNLEGAVYLFKRSGNNWNQQYMLQRFAQNNMHFGLGLAVTPSAEYLAASAYTEDLTFVDQGAVYIYRSTNNAASYTLQQKITMPTPQASAYYGSCLDISSDGSTLVVGAMLETVDGLSDAGAAYVYTRAGTIWTLQARIVAPAGRVQNGAQFGGQCSISPDGNTLFLTARFEDGSVSNSGAAYVYTRTGTTWNYKSRLTATTENADSNFGVNVSHAQGLAVIGAFTADNMGAAYSFKNEN